MVDADWHSSTDSRMLILGPLLCHTSLCLPSYEKYSQAQLHPNGMELPCLRPYCGCKPLLRTPTLLTHCSKIPQLTPSPTLVTDLPIPGKLGKLATQPEAQVHCSDFDNTCICVHVRPKLEEVLPTWHPVAPFLSHLWRYGVPAAAEGSLSRAELLMAHKYGTLQCTFCLYRAFGPSLQ